MKKNTCLFSTLVQEGEILKSQLNTWVVAINSQDTKKLKNLYANKGKLFSTFNGLKNTSEQIENYFNDANIVTVKLDEYSLSFDTKTKTIEGEYTLLGKNGSITQADFAFQFNKKGKITEHASAPKDLSQWQVKNEVSVGVMLTSITVQSVLKRSGALKTPDLSNPQTA